jgi:hypothetical protein
VEDRAGSSFNSAPTGYLFLLRERNFLGLTFIGSFGISSFFVYLSSSSFILINHYKLSPPLYSFFFSLKLPRTYRLRRDPGRIQERLHVRGGFSFSRAAEFDFDRCSTPFRGLIPGTAAFANQTFESNIRIIAGAGHGGMKPQVLSSP